MHSVSSPPTEWLDGPTQALADAVDIFYGNFLAWVLIAIGLYFTVRSRGVQFRLFGEMVRTIFGSRSNTEGGVRACHRGQDRLQ